MRKSLIALAAVAVVGLAPIAGAAENSGPNGGMVMGKGGHATELVVNGNEIAVYLLDHGKIHSADGVSLKAVVQQGGKTESVVLKSTDGKKLTGTLPVAIDKGAIVVLTGKDDHGDGISSRYVIK